MRGHFYESRFGARELVDNVGALVCSIYLDVNQMKAGLARSLEQSKYSAIQQRILAWKAREARASLEKFQSLDDSQDYQLDEATLEQLLADCWLSPIAPNGPLLLAPEQPILFLPRSLVGGPAQADQVGSDQVDSDDASASEPEETNGSAKTSEEGEVAGDDAGQAKPQASTSSNGNGKPTWKIHRRLNRRRRPRPSDHCFLDMPWSQYLEIARWAEARVRQEQAGRAPPEYLQKEDVDPDRWYQAFEQFENWFGRAVGRAENIQRILERGGRRWLRGLRRCRATFR